MKTEKTLVKQHVGLPLDRSFGEAGQIRPNFLSGGARAAQLSADGSLYFATWQDENSLFRATPEGALDPSFGNGTGRVKWHFVHGEESRPSCLLVQADHKILVIGDTRRTDGTARAALTRFHNSGSPDLVFGTVLVPVFEGNYVVMELVSGCLQADGKILIAFGYGTAEGFGSLLIRLKAENGELDDSFGNGGYVDVKSNGPAIELRSVLVRDDGKIIVGGTADDQLVIGCYTPNGEIDSSFAQEGFAYYKSPEGALRMRQLVAQPDGKLVCAGRVNLGAANTKGMVMRFDSNGDPDSSFNEGVPVFTDAGRNTAWNSLAVQADGKIAMTGNNAELGTEPLVVIGRLLPNGSPDPGFGENGWGSVGVGGLSWDVRIQADKRIIVAGENLNDSGNRTPSIYGLSV
ncbi:hypothetical protein [Pseudomonas grandcourensis]|uniref:hypothetical protein n=1 Tax=Pseudomonas grandcourensis TaxID=3136736 RepID=UPI0032656636